MITVLTNIFPNCCDKILFFKMLVLQIAFWPSIGQTNDKKNHETPIIVQLHSVVFILHIKLSKSFILIHREKLPTFIIIIIYSLYTAIMILSY